MANNADVIVTVKTGKSTVISSPGGSALRLVQLDDVTSTPRVSGEVLTWISANGKFEFHPANGAGGFAIDQFARDTSNGAFTQANTANVIGQGAFAKANTANVTAQAAFDKANSIGVIPVGSIVQFAHTNIPASIFLPTDGQTVSRTTYSTLFSEISVKYGSGDGSTTFGIPDIGPVIHSWIPATDIPELMQGHTQNTLPDGRIIVIGGRSSGVGSVSTSVWFGTVVGNIVTWVSGTAIPDERFAHTTTVLSDGRVLVIGGRDSGGGIQDITYFGTISGVTITWVAGTVYPVTVAQHTATLLADGRILCVGGVPNYQLTYFGTISGTTITWAAGTNVPFQTQYHTITLQTSPERIVLIGGRDSSGTILSRVYIATVAGDVITWNQSSYLPGIKSEHVAVRLLSAHILVAGGVGLPYEHTYMATILNHNTNIIVWEEIRNFPVLPELLSQFSASLTDDGRVMTTGGYNGGAQSSNSVFIGTPIVSGIRFA